MTWTIKHTSTSNPWIQAFQQALKHEKPIKILSKTAGFPDFPKLPDIPCWFKQVGELVRESRLPGDVRPGELGREERLGWVLQWHTVRNGLDGRCLIDFYRFLVFYFFLLCFTFCVLYFKVFCALSICLFSFDFIWGVVCSFYFCFLVVVLVDRSWMPGVVLFYIWLLFLLEWEWFLLLLLLFFFCNALCKCSFPMVLLGFSFFPLVCWIFLALCCLFLCCCLFQLVMVCGFVGLLFPTSLCGVLVFRSAPAAPPPPPPASPPQDHSSHTIHHTPSITHHSPLITLHSSHTTHHTPFITHYSSRTTHHIPLITHHSSQTTHHTPFITHHSSHTTHHRPLITHHSSHTTRHTPLDTHHSSTHHIPLITHHSSHTTHHTPFITHHSSHTTHHTPLITHHSSHTTHHTPLITDHSSHTIHHTPLITHHSSHTIHHTPLDTHHSSHTIHHRPFITHHSSHTIHHTPLITHHSSHTIHHTPLDTHHSSHTTHHRPFITHHSTHTTHHIPLVTDHSSHTTHHIPLKTHHSSHTTHHIPLKTHHSSHTTHHTPLITRCFCVAGAVQRASWRSCCALGRRWAPLGRALAFAWQAQYREPPEGAAARLGAAGRRWAARWLLHGRCSTESLLKELLRAWSPLGAARPRGGFCVASAVQRASWRSCCALGRRWAPLGRALAFAWQAQYREPPEGASARLVAAGRRWAIHHTPLITHHSSHTIHHTPLDTHHSSHTIHHRPFITHHSSHTIHHTPLITHHSSHTIHHTPLDTHHSSHTNHHRPFITHHSTHTTHHIPLVTDHSSHTTHHIPLKTHHSSHTTHHIPLKTHHSSHTTHHTPLITRCFCVAGAVQRASWRSCCALGRRWAPLGRALAFAWQAQYREPPEGAAARLGAAGRRWAARWLLHGRCSTESLLKELLRAWSPLGAARPRGGFCVASAVQRASWRSCCALGRRWAPLGRALAFAWQAQYREPPEGASVRLVAAGRRWAARWLLCGRRSTESLLEELLRAWSPLGAAGVRLAFVWQAQYREPPEGAAARLVAAGRRWAARWLLCGRRSTESLLEELLRAGFCVAGAVQRASWRSCCALGRRWAPLGRAVAFAWQVQYREPPEGAAARLVAAGRRWAARWFLRGKRSIESLLKELLRAWSPLGAAGPCGGFCVAGAV